MKNKKLAPYLFLLVLLLITLALKRGCDNQPSITQKNKTNSHPKDVVSTHKQGLDRNPKYINYSKHARCRMDCRKISESEIKSILKTGKINYRKSELQNTECHKKYAVEGYSADGQHIRIIAAPCADELTIVTCIDLDKEWQCECP